MQTVTVEGDSKLQSIGGWAFYNCGNLMSIVIPSTVESVGENAFQGCNQLTINCEAEQQPATWNSNWNPDACPVKWGYKQQ